MNNWLQECLATHPTVFQSDKQRLDSLCEVVGQNDDVKEFMSQQRIAVRERLTFGVRLVQCDHSFHASFVFFRRDCFPIMRYRVPRPRGMQKT